MLLIACLQTIVLKTAIPALRTKLRKMSECLPPTVADTPQSERRAVSAVLMQIDNAELIVLNHEGLKYFLLKCLAT